MAVPTWGMLTKSQIDPETIEEAIARLIQEHNENEEAHLGPGQSLQSHKASEIIDHLVASIIADKIKEGQIDLSKLSADRLTLISVFESFDGWEQYKYGNGLLTKKILGFSISSGTVAGNYYILSAEPGSNYAVLNFQKDPLFQTTVEMPTGLARKFVFGCGSAFEDENWFGFRVLNSVLYAVHYNGTVEVTTSISGVDLTKNNVFRAWFNADENKIFFYINGVLKATHDANLPTGDATSVIFYWVENVGGNITQVWIRDLLFTIKK
jgi:hypothetical protein